MVKQETTKIPSVNQDIEINLDNDLKSYNETIDSATINMSSDILDDFMKGKPEGNRIILTGSFISFQFFINDIISKIKSKPSKFPSGSIVDRIEN
jgi:hypothetical protein